MLVIGVIFCSLKCTSVGEYATDSESIAKGETLFQNNCSACHNFKNSGIGPNLAGLTEEMPATWIHQFIANSQKMIAAKDQRAVQLFEQYKQYMPAFEGILQPEEIEQVLAYMNTFPKPIIEASAANLGEPIENPIPEKIPLSDITLNLNYLTTAPPTADKPPLTRINTMLPMPSKAKRLFINDLRGVLYELKDKQLQPFLSIAETMPNFIHEPGKATGMGSFAFHPTFEKNGLFYTTHTENPKIAAPADFGYADTIPVKVRWVLTEWKQNDPKSAVFKGTNRELLRIDMVTGIHGMQEIAFNPLAKPGDSDYGMLYVGLGDGGSVEQKYSLVQNKHTVWGSIIRIDPLGNNSKNGKYGIPTDNPYASDTDPLTAKEVWARGFRNPHRMTWDTKGDGKMLASDIGQHSIEELNQILPGKNYGWAEREGTFVLNKRGDLHYMYPLPKDDQTYNFTYPVLQIDHDEANAISSGYVYYGKKIPALYGKYIFGDIVNGRVFCADASTFQLGKQASVEEIQLHESGKKTDLETLTNDKRVDLRFGLDAEGELYLFTKADGKIYTIESLNL
ncbi:MAG: c-type cytochrome [Saprospiraceae bacterium]|nr:c-type cytochrome [Saprospiraceae bacterium]